ncbi:MAG: methylmalonyl-CoA mutase family protein, partial [Candidatus Hydrogenedentes bacterium]|jgi:methylmalonyl-CoA mutase|nr:methylmalonyl-CoA mutase family protein [Candidatus Hydrogenedentota bacterium]
MAVSHRIPPNYQERSKIQEKSHYYEALKTSGEHPIVGLDTFVNPATDLDGQMDKLELRRGSGDERRSQVEGVRAFQRRHEKAALNALKHLRDVALAGGNVFEALMETVQVCSLGQITQTLFQVGGQYRWNT